MISISLNLKSLKNSFESKFKDNDGQVRKCICIPVEDNDVFLSAKGGAYLNLTGFETTNFGNIYNLKQSFSKEKYSSMTAEEKRQIPFVGNIKPFGKVETQNVPMTPAPALAETAPDNSNLPF